MPVKLNYKLPQESVEARIEIIPLIDIMFFLLAAFMLVSLSMVNLKSVKVNLPAASASSSDAKQNFVDISVDSIGSFFLNLKPVGSNELISTLAASARVNPNLHVVISGDTNSRHGDIIHVLDLVRSAGIDKVAFEISHAEKAHLP